MYKFKAFADSKINTTKKFVSVMVESILEQGGNAGYQHFLLFLQYFQRETLSKGH